jgi:hypothetical protein
VAATRAKTRLFLTYPRETIAPDRTRHFCTISPFLAQLSAGLINNVSPGGSHTAAWRACHAVPFRKSQTWPFPAKRRRSLGRQRLFGTGKITSTGKLSPGMAVKHPFFGHGQIKKITGEKDGGFFSPATA